MSPEIKIASVIMLLLWLTVVILPAILKRRRERKQEEAVYGLTTVVITKEYGPVMVYLDKYTKELIPADNDLQKAENYPPVLLPEDLINGEIQWSTAVSRLEFLLKK